MSPSKKRGGKPDGNQAEIVKVLRKLGAKVLIVSQIPNSFDLLVFHKGKCLPVEVKMPGRKLTPGEKDFKEAIEAKGVRYNVIHSVEEAIELLGVQSPTLMNIINLDGHCPLFPPCVDNNPSECDWCKEHTKLK